MSRPQLHEASPSCSRCSRSDGSGGARERQLVQMVFCGPKYSHHSRRAVQLAIRQDVGVLQEEGPRLLGVVVLRLGARGP